MPDGQWYLHSFAPEQPDLNWRNPEVQAAIDEVLRFWLDRGVDGFRVDAVPHLVEDDLLREALPRLDALLAEGVTTIEIKSGYGLTIAQFEALANIRAYQPIT